MVGKGGSPEHMRMIRELRTYERTDPLGRLLDRTERQPPRPGQALGCLLYVGAQRKNGYPVVGEGRSGWHYGHRLVYERAHGAIPDGHRVHHTCERTLCVEQSHLQAVTAREHAAEHGLAAGPCRRCGADDWYVRPDTRTRQCRECKRRRRRAACG